MLITRKVITSAEIDQIRAAVELHRNADNWMAAMIRALDPFQRAEDLKTNWFDLAKSLCVPTPGELQAEDEPEPIQDMENDRFREWSGNYCLPRA
ncbi:MAG TPA: hypothetical protein VHA06_08075 [Candidatus Angelobacter sp.]|nr:hypothetical protein [Candidatus Angelobacter sp.]